MKQSKVLLVSVFITVVILVIAGGVTTTVMANNAAAEREAAYQQLIQQANDQLVQANAQLQEMQTRLAQVQAAQSAQPVNQQISSQASDSQAAAGDQVQDFAILADQADQIALKAVALGSKKLKAPELVDFEGNPAYEVAYDKGSIYVDAQSGEILFNGTVPQTITLEKAAQIAGDYTNNHAILKVDQVQQGSHLLYRVIFKNGNMAYLDMTGQILYINQAQPAGPVEPQISTASSNGSSHKSSSHSSENDHEDD
jgi:uncharacterized membrane protein YkoI